MKEFVRAKGSDYPEENPTQLVAGLKELHRPKEFVRVKGFDHLEENLVQSAANLKGLHHLEELAHNMGIQKTAFLVM